ncbi:MAG: cytochrome c [Planctomycetaceae bacterium]|nr:cytochrome c [Planctomycetaceae bacterium]
MTRQPWLPTGGAVAVAISLAVHTLWAAEVPQPPALSALVPAEDLVGQIEDYVEELEGCVTDQEEYEDSAEKLTRYADSLAVIALAVGLHDQDSRLRRAAPALVKAAQDLAGAKDFAAAKAGVAAVKASLNSSGDPSTLRWHKVARLKTLMEQVPLINTRIKRYIRRFDKGAPEIAGGSAAIVAISQGSMANADETVSPDKIAEWFKYCAEMRDAAGALNKAAHAKDEGAATAAMTALQQSCDDCHTVFHKDAL